MTTSFTSFEHDGAVDYLGQELQVLQQSGGTVLDFIWESALDGVWYWDLDEAAHKWGNDNFWRTLGYDPAALPNQTEAWPAVISPDEVAAVQRGIAAGVADGSHTYHQLVQCAHRNGSVVCLHCRGLVVCDGAGRPRRALGVLVDITQRRNAEVYAREVAGHYSAILSNQSVYIVKTDAQGLYTYVNDFFFERFGADSKIIGTPSLLTIVEEDRPKCLAVVGQCFLEPEVPHQVVLRKPCKDHQVRSNHWEFKGLLGADGQVAEILCVGYDVTLLIDQLEQSKRLLTTTTQQNARLQNFAYIISHNIRSHSANLTALVTLMQAAPDAENAALFLQMLKTSTDKLAETIVNLNEIVTADGPVQHLREPRELRREVDRTLEALNVFIYQSGVAVAVDIPAGLTVPVVPAYLDSILLNLLSNAIKYRAADAPRVALGGYREGGYVVLTVGDNGLGIDLARHRDKVFGMYKTFHANADARGLGLFIAKSQVEAMGGRIELESAVGVGSTFKVYFNESV
ncbi:ATP-binding protein [Hymenobacter caeli]|uniref:histidine kinase n=1 Tax=Hymenobacter caeli TaxID=2735894 RepID=A0ABX2FQC1_9BACT|nr:ATP-binding protein [Hymenobacter caeli]NRT18647.1 PAS domain S-box-containing protein [Hymenobacter caeli]